MYIFSIYAGAHFVVLVWCLRLASTRHAPGALLIAMLAAGLAYDSSIIALGKTIGIGPLLEMLSWPRFAMHALLTPFMMVAVTRLGEAGGVRWTATTAWQVIVWFLVAVSIVIGALDHLIGLKLQPACFSSMAGTIIRYTANLHSSQFCFAGQVASQSLGPPVSAVVGTVVTLIVGFGLWRRSGWLWLMVGAMVMFGAAVVPSSGFGLAPGNGGEVLLLVACAATVARFSRARQSSIAS